MNVTQEPSRREFLKGNAVAAGLVLAGGLNLARAAYAAGGDELRIALIGCGGRGSGAVNDCLASCDNVKLIAVADAFDENAKSCLANLRKIPEITGKIDVPADRVFVGFDAYQKAIAAGPDIVFLATPPGFRPIHYAAAVHAGKHVFMEKPVCVDAPGFRALMEANKLADEKALKVAVGLQRRHSEKFLGSVKAIQEGSLGNLVLLRAYWNDSGIWVRPRQPNQTEMEYQMRNWYHFVWLCGDRIC
jgi:predicted dehydrogenase